jgi:fimbrial chaperone protein
LIVRIFRYIMAIALLAWTLPATAAEWRVTPIRLDLGKEARTGAISIVNEGSERINYEIKVVEWTQDAEGQDQYTDTSDIIFFPKILTLDGKAERVVRAGITAPPVSAEKSYRIFIEELPQPRKDNQTGVALAVRFGIPVFVKPLKDEAKGTIDPPRIDPTAITTVIRNSGTVNLNLKGIVFTGKDQQGLEVFSRETRGWYLLTGMSRQYSATITAEECRRASTLEIEAKNDKIPLKVTATVDQTRCGP